VAPKMKTPEPPLLRHYIINHSRSTFLVLGVHITHKNYGKKFPEPVPPIFWTRLPSPELSRNRLFATWNRVSSLVENI